MGSCRGRDGYGFLCCGNFHHRSEQLDTGPICTRATEAKFVTQGFILFTSSLCMAGLVATIFATFGPCWAGRKVSMLCGGHALIATHGPMSSVLLPVGCSLTCLVLTPHLCTIYWTSKPCPNWKGLTNIRATQGNSALKRCNMYFIQCY